MKYYDKRGGTHKTILGARLKNLDIRTQERAQETANGVFENILHICEKNIALIQENKYNPELREDVNNVIANVMITASDLTQTLASEYRVQVIGRFIQFLGITEVVS